MKLEALPQAFADYVKTFPQEDMITLKYEHTQRVVANAREIMAGETFPEELQAMGEMAAWLHDLGRFKQFCKYRTFSDRQSVNHALLSCAVALEPGWLDDLPPETRNRILQAIALHNLREVPPALSEADSLLVHLVRDADKLDIYTVLDQAIATNYLPSHPEVYWGLPFAAPPSPKIVCAIEQGESIDYGDIHSFADFVFIQLAWCNGGLFFRESAKMVLQRGEVDIRRDYLCQILPASQEVITRCCDVARQALERKVYGA